MPPGGDSGITNSGPLNEMPPDGYLLAKEPGADGAPPDGAYLERLANKDQVNTIEDDLTLDCGRNKVASLAALPASLAALPKPPAIYALPKPSAVIVHKIHLHHQAKESSQSFRTLVLIGVAAACAVLTPFSTPGLCTAGRTLCRLLSRRQRHG